MPSMSTERLINIKRRLEIFLAGATPFAVQAFLAFMSWAEQNLLERQLQVIQLSQLGTAVAAISSGTMPRIYGIYLKKQTNAGTASYFMEFDDAANPNTATEKRIQFALQDDGKEAFGFYPDGLLMANGVVVLAATTANGTTGSGATDGPNGFVIIG